jgi:hypothetical protein
MLSSYLFNIYTKTKFASWKQFLKLEDKKELENHRTAKLWIQYMHMIDILRRFIRAERTGQWKLHLQATYDMLPYFASAGHNLYAKSCHIYLHRMAELKENHPTVYQAFVSVQHVVRRSDRFWSGLPTDLIIEQVLMCSVKTTGGLTRDRGMTEMQRLVWVLSMPACAEVNNAMQTLTGKRYETSEQHIDTTKHKDTTEARKQRDHKHTQEIVEYLRNRNPDSSLCNIITGVVADDNVNADNAKDVGDKTQ